MFLLYLKNRKCKISITVFIADLHMVQLMPLPPHHLLLQYNPEWFTFLVPAYPGCPGKKAIKWM